MDRAEDQLIVETDSAGDPASLAVEVQRSRERLDVLVDAIAEKARRSRVGASLAAVRRAQDRLAGAGVDAAARCERLRATLVRFPRERPLTLIAAAAALGFVLGLLAPRRS